MVLFGIVICQSLLTKKYREQSHMVRFRLVFPSLVGFIVVLLLLNNSYNGYSNIFKATRLPRSGIKDDIEERNRLVTKFCGKHRDNRLSNRTTFFLKSTKLYVDDNYKFIYCHMPKTASTTWLKVLLKLRSEHYKKFPHKASHRMTLASYTPEQAIYRVRTYFKFLFVREPLERLLSAYKHMLRKSDTEYMKGLAPVTVLQFQYQNSSSENEKKIPVHSFPEFLRYLSSNIKTMRQLTLKSMDVWNSLVNVCKPCLMDYDFIGHYETLGRDADFVLKKIGVDKLTKFPAWKPTNTSREALSYYKQLSREQKRSIYELTKNDYEIFGYRTVIDSFG